MSVKFKVEEITSPSNTKIKYPYLGIFITDSLEEVVILFTSKESGVYLTPTHTRYSTKVGESSTTIIESKFSPLEGYITLSNE